MLAAVEDAVSYRWGHVEEILAEIVEAIEGQTLAFLMANTPKNRWHELPKQRRYPRPTRPDAQLSRRSWLDVLSSMGRRR